MKVRKLRSLFALVAAGLAALVLIQPQSAIGQVSTQPGLPDGGVLRLHLGSTGSPKDYFKWQPTTGSDTGAITQSISPSGPCGLTPESGALVGLFATGGSVGFVSDGIGVKGPGEGTGQPCGRVDAGQTLSLQLGTGLTNKALDFAEIDLEGKFGAAFTITGSLGTSSKTETYATTGPDSGPDSGDGDNFRIRYPISGEFLFTKLTFAVTAGAISLEGGADGTQACDSTDPFECQADGSLGETILDGPGSPTPTKDSLFHLVKFDGYLGCDQLAPSETGGGTTVSFKRLNNIDGSSGNDCLAIPYSLDVFAGQVDLLKDLLGEDAQFRVVITWPAKTETYPMSATTIDYDGAGGAAPVALKWCLADGTNNTADGFPDLPTGPVHFYCIEKQEATDGLASGLVTVKETLYGQLDPTIRR